MGGTNGKTYLSCPSCPAPMSCPSCPYSYLGYYETYLILGPLTCPLPTVDTVGKVNRIGAWVRQYTSYAWVIPPFARPSKYTHGTITSCLKSSIAYWGNPLFPCCLFGSTSENGPLCVIRCILYLPELASNPVREVLLNHIVLLSLHVLGFLIVEKMIVIIVPSQKIEPRSPRESCHFIQNPPLVRDAYDTYEVEGIHPPKSVHHRIIAVGLNICNLWPQDDNVLVGPHVKKGDTRSNAAGLVVNNLVHIMMQGG